MAQNFAVLVATKTGHTPAANPPRVSFLSGVGAFDDFNMNAQSSLTMVLHQLNPFEVGQVKAHVEHGLSAAAIAERVFKADGKTKFGETAIQNCINKLMTILDGEVGGKKVQALFAKRRLNKTKTLSSGF